MACAYVENYFGPKRQHKIEDHLRAVANSEYVFWRARGRWWSGTRTDRIKADECGHYTEVVLDNDSLSWGLEQNGKGYVLTSILLTKPYKVEPSIGYFDCPDQEVPTHEPGLDGACPVCALPLRDKPVRTVSVTPHDPAIRVRCAFYRMHSACAGKTTDRQAQALDSFALVWAPPNSQA